MYARLRTNLPREVMAYTDFAFDDLAGQSKDSRRFPSHEEVCIVMSQAHSYTCPKKKEKEKSMPLDDHKAHNGSL